MKTALSLILILIFSILCVAQEDYEYLLEWIPNLDATVIRLNRMEDKAEQESWLRLKVRQGLNVLAEKGDSVETVLDELGLQRLGAKFLTYDHEDLQKTLMITIPAGKKVNFAKLPRADVKRNESFVYETYDSAGAVGKMLEKGLIEDSGEKHDGHTIYSLYHKSVQWPGTQQERYLMAANGLYILISTDPQLLVDMYDSGVGILENYAYHKDYKEVEKLIKYGDYHAATVSIPYHFMMAQMRARGEEIDDQGLLEAMKYQPVHFFRLYAFGYGDVTTMTDISVYPKSLVKAGVLENKGDASAGEADYASDEDKLRARYFEETTKGNWVISICKDYEAFQEERAVIQAKYSNPDDIQGITEEQRELIKKKNIEILGKAKKKKQ
jgi:hypothetical protein